MPNQFSPYPVSHVSTAFRIAIETRNGSEIVDHALALCKLWQANPARFDEECGNAVLVVPDPRMPPSEPEVDMYFKARKRRPDAYQTVLPPGKPWVSPASRPVPIRCLCEQALEEYRAKAERETGQEVDLKC